jgi:hypothetical protein
VPVAFWVLVFAIGLAATIDALADGYGYPGELVRWLAVMALVGVAILQVHRHVLRRPRPLADPDVLAADDAIRTRTLHVLSGSTMAIGAISPRRSSRRCLDTGCGSTTERCRPSASCSRRSWA